MQRDVYGSIMDCYSISLVIFRSDSQEQLKIHSFVCFINPNSFTKFNRLQWEDEIDFFYIFKVDNSLDYTILNTLHLASYYQTHYLFHVQ